MQIRTFICKTISYQQNQPWYHPLSRQRSAMQFFFTQKHFFFSTDMKILFFAIAAALNDRLLFVHLFFLAQSTWTLSSLGRLTGQSVLLSSVR